MKDTAFPSSSRVLRRLLQGLGVLLLSGLVAALVLLALALHDQPLVRREAASMSAEDLLRVKLLLRAADPRACAFWEANGFTPDTGGPRRSHLLTR